MLRTESETISPRVRKAVPFKAKELKPHEVYIGRASWGYPKSKWHNPFKEGEDGTLDEVLAKFEQYLLGNASLMSQLPELRGKDLVCWCHPKPCHGDLLLKLANQMEGGN